MFQANAAFGSYFVRLAARNSCSVGPPTADLQVTVAPCTAAPGAPTGLAYTRAGSIVTLTWNNPAAPNLPSRFEVHAGSSTGASDLLVFTTTGNGTSFQAVAPPGTYYVRVKGVNNCGPSLDSNEIVVVVP
ncbi:MAG: fibronectin type III domain-containing protein [Vicinamibacterales bacterium]